MYKHIHDFIQACHQITDLSALCVIEGKKVNVMDLCYGKCFAINSEIGHQKRKPSNRLPNARVRHSDAVSASLFGVAGFFRSILVGSAFTMSADFQPLDMYFANRRRRFESNASHTNSNQDKLVCRDVDVAFSLLDGLFEFVLSSDRPE